MKDPLLDTATTGTAIDEEAPLTGVAPSPISSSYPTGYNTTNTISTLLQEQQQNEERTCRICLEEDNSWDMIAPCKCKGSSKWVHRECLNLWRTNEKDRAFGQCTECLFSYHLQPRQQQHDQLQSKVEQRRKVKFYLSVTRDICSFHWMVQVIIILVGIIISSLDSQRLIPRSLFAMNKTYLTEWKLIGTYYLCSFLSLLIALGIYGCIVLCSNGCSLEASIPNVATNLGNEPPTPRNTAPTKSTTANAGSSTHLPTQRMQQQAPKFFDSTNHNEQQQQQEQFRQRRAEFYLSRRRQRCNNHDNTCCSCSSCCYNVDENGRRRRRYLDCLDCLIYCDDCCECTCYGCCNPHYSYYPYCTPYFGPNGAGGNCCDCCGGNHSDGDCNNGDGCCCCCCCCPGDSSNGGGGDGNGGNDCAHVLIVVLLIAAIVLAIIGFVVGIFISIFTIQVILRKHIHLLHKRQLVHEFEVLDLSGYDLDDYTTPSAPPPSAGMTSTIATTAQAPSHLGTTTKGTNDMFELSMDPLATTSTTNPNTTYVSDQQHPLPSAPPSSQETISISQQANGIQHPPASAPPAPPGLRPADTLYLQQLGYLT